MNNCIKKMKEKYNSSGEYTKFIAKIVICFLISSVVAYMHISWSENFSLLLLADDMAYAIRSSFVIGVIGLLVVRWMEGKINK